MSTSVSLIISTYTDAEALTLILNALRGQTSHDFNVVVAQDAQTDAFKKITAKAYPFAVQLVSHPDVGWRKNAILNQAIGAAPSDYLIFIDGDCVPFPNFIQEHLDLRTQNTVQCGRRVDLGAVWSNRLRTGTVDVGQLAGAYVKHYLSMNKDGVRHWEEGVYFKPHSLLRRWGNRKANKKQAHILGCHWACYKSDLLKINGFDEDFVLPTTGEDTDIERRMRHFGIQMRSCRNRAILLHLYHAKNFNEAVAQQTMALMHSKHHHFVCRNGVEKHAGCSGDQPQ